MHIEQAIAKNLHHKTRAKTYALDNDRVFLARKGAKLLGSAVAYHATNSAGRVMFLTTEAPDDATRDALVTTAKRALAPLKRRIVVLD